MTDPIGYVVVEHDPWGKPDVTGEGLVDDAGKAQQVARSCAELRSAKGWRYTVGVVVPVEAWERLNARLDDVRDNALGELM